MIADVQRGIPLKVCLHFHVLIRHGKGRLGGVVRVLGQEVVCFLTAYHHRPADEVLSLRCSGCQVHGFTHRHSAAARYGRIVAFNVRSHMIADVQRGNPLEVCRHLYISIRHGKGHLGGVVRVRFRQDVFRVVLLNTIQLHRPVGEGLAGDLFGGHGHGGIRIHKVRRGHCLLTDLCFGIHGIYGVLRDQITMVICSINTVIVVLIRCRVIPVIFLVRFNPVSFILENNIRSICLSGHFIPARSCKITFMVWVLYLNGQFRCIIAGNHKITFVAQVNICDRPRYGSAHNFGAMLILEVTIFCINTISATYNLTAINLNTGWQEVVLLSKPDRISIGCRYRSCIDVHDTVSVFLQQNCISLKCRYRAAINFEIWVFIFC